MASNSLVSIIVPIYNVAPFLDKCIESLLSQTYLEIGIILIDDGSTDNSGNIADQYAQSYDNISVIHQENKGLSAARNVGLTIAKGQWVVFVDSDDYVEKNYISKLIKIAIKNDTDIATCTCQKVDMAGNIINECTYNWPKEIMTGKETIEYRLSNLYGTHIWLCLFRTEIFKQNNIRFPEGREYETYAVMMEALCHAQKVAFTNEKLYYYVSREGSITHKKFSEGTYNDKIAAMEDMKSFSEKQMNGDIYKYLDYYRFNIINGILNDISKEKAPCSSTKEIWRATRKQLISLYPQVKFPNIKTRIKRSLLLILSCNQYLYNSAYNRMGK